MNELFFNISMSHAVLYLATLPKEENYVTSFGVDLKAPCFTLFCSSYPDM